MTIPVFEPRQVVFMHQDLWDFVERVLKQRGLETFPIPNGVGDDGQPVLDNPDDLPTYGIKPVNL